MESSPFIERPAPNSSNTNMGSSPLKPLSFDAISNAANDTNSQLKTEIHSLNFQIKELRSQLSVTKLESEAKLNELLKKLELKSQEYDEISSNNVYLFQLNKDINGKIEHLSENFQVKESKNEETIKELRTQLERYRRGYEEFQVQNKSLLSGKQKWEIDQRFRENELTSELQKLHHSNQAKDHEMNSLRTQLTAQISELTKLQQNQKSSSHTDEEYTLIKSQLSDQVQYIKDLERKNLQQAEQIKQLNLNKQNSVILKAENMELANKLKKSLELGDTINELSLENAELSTQLENFKLYLGEESKEDIEEALKKLKANKDDYDLLQNNFNNIRAEFKQLSNRYNEALINQVQASQTISEFEIKNANLSKFNKELELQRDLSFEESKILRTQLTELTDELQVNENDKDNYIKSLEQLLEDYKAKLDKLQSETTELSNKRQRLDNSFNEDTTRSIQLSNDKLKEELFELTNKYTKINNENVILLKKLENLEKLQQKQKTYRVVQLRNNPLAQDQFVKKQHLDLLQKENEALRSTKLQDVDVVPKAVYDSQKFENDQLQTTIDNLTKKSLRLSQVFQSKSLEMIELFYKTLGYKLEFISTSKIKLYSKFAPDQFITLDLIENTLKTSTSLEKDTNRKSFQDTCNEHIDFWVRGKGEIPCFLAALTLDLFEQKQNQTGI